MRCFVTGASGFVGANLVHELLAQGHTVRALVRADSDLRGLSGADSERIEGGLDDVALLSRALKGCEWCFHAAASYHLWLRDYAPMYQANVEGTRNVMEAAAKADCARIVYTSTVGCIGLPKQTQGAISPTDETAPVTESQMRNHYKLSKWRAEEVARGLAAKGLPIVIVNPSAPIGPRDVKPTPTGQVIVDFLNGAMPGYVDTGLNWVHVRDVVRGHILAAEKGKVGERYILGHAEGNWTMGETLAVLADLTGKPAPRLQVPYGVALAAAYVSEAVARITGKPPKAPLAGVRMARYKMFFDPAKAIRELGLPQTPPRQALSDAVEWFTANGYVRGARLTPRSP
jgi:dihydroflavonol-4-reductase